MAEVMANATLLERTAKTRGLVSAAATKGTVFLCGVVLLGILIHFLCHPLLIPAEAALNIEYGKLILAGKSPYLDFYDYTSPFAMYMAVLPCYISSHLPIHPILAANLCIWFALVLSTSLSSLVLMRTPSRENSLAPFLLIGFVVFNFLIRDYFGETQQLLFTFTTPYIFSRIYSSTKHDVDLRILGFCGAFAAFGFLLDPLYLLLLILFEAFICLEKGTFKSLSSADFTSCFSVLVIAGILLIVCAEPVGMSYSGFGYFMMMIDYYNWDNQLVYLGMTPDRRDLIYFSFIAVALGLSFSRRSRMISPMVAISVLGFGLYVLQGKMFTHQAIPMLFGAFMCLSLVAGVLFSWSVSRLSLKEKARNTGFIAVLVLAVLGLTVYGYLEYSDLKRADSYSLAEQGYVGASSREDLSIFADYLLKETSPGDSVLFINDQARPAYPLLLQIGRNPGSGFLSTRLLKIAHRLRFSQPVKVWQNYVVKENDLYERLKEDIRSKKPRLIIVNQDSMGPALEEKLVSKEILDSYEPKGFLDWNEDKDSHPPFEYTGYRTAFHVFKLKEADSK